MPLATLRGRPPAREGPDPDTLVPMKATAGALPRGDNGWGFEFKWDGIRAIAHVRRGALRLHTRNLIDVTPQYPELGPLAAATKHDVVLDGEIVAFDEKGRPDFGRLQQRMNLASATAVQRRGPSIPVTFLLFDLLVHDGTPLLSRPYTARRQRLEALRLTGDAWGTPDFHEGDGQAVFEASRDRGLEGVIAKRLTSRYEPGVRSPNWLKIKHRLRQEFVVGGWTRGAGSREGALGAFLVGYYDKHGDHTRPLLVYAGKVGTGFTEEILDRLGKLLAPLAREKSPFAVGEPDPDAHFVEPRLVIDVEFAEWTRHGTLRQPSYKGIRIDQEPIEVVREPAPSPTREAR